MKLLGAIDSPAENELVYQHGLQVSGWVELGDGTPWHAVVIRSAEHVLGATALPLDRRDVATAVGRPDATCGFIVYCAIAEPLRGPDGLELTALVVDGAGNWTEFGKRMVRLSEIDYRRQGHGIVVTDQPPRVLHRDEVYRSGPPSPNADPICVDLVMRYLRQGERVLDVGCGIGAYRDPLEQRGIRWTGCEANPELLGIMQARGLPVVASTLPLPFGDAEFDATICIEVLEHVEDYERFIAESARVARRAAVYSVPNFGAIPIAAAMYALPWHMLEPDHRNFFTARSLRAVLEPHYRHVETFEYGPLDLLRSYDGVAINNHVMAVCLH